MNDEYKDVMVTVKSDDDSRMSRKQNKGFLIHDEWRQILIHCQGGNGKADLDIHCQK